MSRAHLAAQCALDHVYNNDCYEHFSCMQMAHRAHAPTLASNEGDKDFWERDMSKLLEEDLGLREAVCQLFRKVEGGSGV